MTKKTTVKQIDYTKLALEIYEDVFKAKIKNDFRDNDEIVSLIKAWVDLGVSHKNISAMIQQKYPMYKGISSSSINRFAQQLKKGISK